MFHLITSNFFPPPPFPLCACQSKYNPTAGKGSSVDCQPCAMDKSSGSGAAVCCPIGYYSPAGSTTCSKCPANAYCPLGAQSATGCASGTFSPSQGGASVCCSLGYYFSANLTSCIACPDGQFTVSQAPTSPSACQSCPVGYFCSGGVKTLCPAGKYAETASSPFCLPCPAGRFGSTTGLASSNCTGLCAAGRYGVENAISPSCKDDCEVGYFGMSSTLRTTSLCDGQCAPGYLGSSSGQTSSSCNSPCPQGSFCPAGSTQPTPCSAGRRS